MFKGKLYLDYEGDPQYSAVVSRCIFRENEIVFEFSGVRGEEGGFQGHAKVISNGDKYSGEGDFIYADGTAVKASIILEAVADGEAKSLVGTWQDDGDPEPYDLEIDLEPADGSS